MEYKVPEHIKIICDKDKLDDPDINDEQEKVKKEIVKYLEDYLDLKKGKNSLVDVTGVVRDVFKCKWTVYTFERDIGGRMMRSRNYTMRELVNEGSGKEILVIAADRDWWDRNKLWFTILTTGAAALIGIMANPLKGLLHTEPNNQYLIRDTIQVRLQTTVPAFRQVDTVYNLPIVKKDSSKAETATATPNE